VGKENEVIGICHTFGKGHWTHTRSPVIITDLRLYHYTDEEYGELEVYFDTESWCVSRDGWIYTDPNWLADFQRLMVSSGFTIEAARSIEYTEFGMQASDYVSLEVNSQFILECDPLLNFTHGYPPKSIPICDLRPC